MKAMAKIDKMMFMAFILLSCRCNCVWGIRPNLSVKTIKTKAGDIFDCVDLYKQPAFDHPSLRNHQILMRPAGVSFEDFPRGVPKENDTLNVETEDGGCPVGTVPVHRLPKTKSNVTGNQVLDGAQKEVLHLWAGREGKPRNHFGASGRINLYSVQPVGPLQESAAVIGIKNTDPPRQTQPEILAGWREAPAIFGDAKPRLFIEWSANGWQTSCINLRCPGFVQTNHKVSLGVILSPLSTYMGPQYYIYIHLYKDVRNNWWLAIKDVDNVIGYWPSEIFKNFGYGTTPYFAGYVVCQRGEVCPPMGNGRLPGKFAFYDHACFIQRVQVIGPDFKWGGLGHQHQRSYTDNWKYDVGWYTHDVHGFKFSFGGPPVKTK